MQFKEFLNGVVDNRGRNPDEYTNTGRHPVLDNYLIKNEIHPNLNAVDRYISEDIYKNFLRGYVKKDMVVMTLVGNGIGNVTTIPTEDVVIIQNTIGFHTKKELLIDRYLYYYLLDKQEVIKGFNRGSGQPSIKKTDILNMEVVFPSILTQEKIVSILAPIDDKIELNNKINDNLEQQAQAIFKSWFVDFEPFGGKMPNTWQCKNFSEILAARKEKSSDDAIPLFSVTDVGILPRDSKFLKTLSKETTKNKIAYRNDLIFGMSRKKLNWGILHNDIGAVSSAYNVFSVCNSVDPYYLEMYIKFKINYFMDIIKPAAREGQGIDKTALFAKQIHLPSDDIMRKYKHYIEPINAYIKNMHTENILLTELRDSLLPKLMSGEIDVSNVKI